MYDLHIHTVHSPDSHDGAFMEAYAELALSKGYQGIGFSDHLEFDPDDDGCGYLDYDRYSRDIDAVRKKYEGRLTILKGIEVSYQREFSDAPKRYFAGKDFDYLIGAVHFVARCPFHHGDRYFRGKTAEAAFRAYFEEVERTVESGLFDILAHFDHLKRYSIPVYGSYTLAPHAGQIEQILSAVARSGMALEINTSGYRHAFRESFPAEPTIREYVRLGGRCVTLGSDSHAPAQFGTGIPEAVDLARRAGLGEAVYYVSRRRQAYPITG